MVITVHQVRHWPHYTIIIIIISISVLGFRVTDFGEASSIETPTRSQQIYYYHYHHHHYYMSRSEVVHDQALTGTHQSNVLCAFVTLHPTLRPPFSSRHTTPPRIAAAPS